MFDDDDTVTTESFLPTLGVQSVVIQALEEGRVAALLGKHDVSVDGMGDITCSEYEVNVTLPDGSTQRRSRRMARLRYVTKTLYALHLMNLCHLLLRLHFPQRHSAPDCSCQTSSALLCVDSHCCTRPQQQPI